VSVDLVLYLEAIDGDPVKLEAPFELVVEDKHYGFALDDLDHFGHPVDDLPHLLGIDLDSRTP
jgi:hypothetical protein